MRFWPAIEAVLPFFESCRPSSNAHRATRPPAPA
jgi:hypothetical protein